MTDDRVSDARSSDRTISSTRRAFVAESLAAGGLAVTAGPDAFATESTGSFRQRVERVAMTRHVPGVAIASRVKGRTRNICFGFAAGSSPATPATIFEAASLSKPVFALGVLGLIRAGALRLDSPIATIVDFRQETDDPRVLRITPRHALTHSSGLPNWRFEPGPLRCRFEPGTRFSYSGEGIFLLQRAVEHLVSTGLAHHMRRHVLEPLGMSSSAFAFDTHFEKQMARPHDASGTPSQWRTLLVGRQLVERARMRNLPLERWTWEDVRDVLPSLDPPQKMLPVFATINAASSLLTTADDYAHVGAAIARHPLMTLPQHAVTNRIAWGLGVGLELASDRTAFHWGDNDGFKSMFAADVKRSDTNVVLTNGDGGIHVAIDAIGRRIGNAHPLLEWVDEMYR